MAIIVSIKRECHLLNYSKKSVSSQAPWQSTLAKLTQIRARHVEHKSVHIYYSCHLTVGCWMIINLPRTVKARPYLSCRICRGWDSARSQSSGNPNLRPTAVSYKTDCIVCPWWRGGVIKVWSFIMTASPGQARSRPAFPSRSLFQSYRHAVPAQIFQVRIFNVVGFVIDVVLSVGSI